MKFTEEVIAELKERHTKQADGRWRIESILEGDGQYTVYAEVKEGKVFLSDGGLALSELRKAFKHEISNTIKFLVSVTVRGENAFYDHEKNLLTMQVKRVDEKNGSGSFYKTVSSFKKLITKVIAIKNLYEEVAKSIPKQPRVKHEAKNAKHKISVTGFIMERMVTDDTHDTIYDVTAEILMPYGEIAAMKSSFSKGVEHHPECEAEFDRILLASRPSKAGFTSTDIAEFYAMHPDKETRRYHSLTEGFDPAFRERMIKYILTAEIRDRLESCISQCGAMLKAINSNEFQLEYKP